MHVLFTHSYFGAEIHIIFHYWKWHNIFHAGQQEKGN